MIFLKVQFFKIRKGKQYRRCTQQNIFKVIYADF